LYKKNTTSKFQHFFKFSATFVYRDCRKGVGRKLNKGGGNPIQVLHVYQTELWNLMAMGIRRCLVTLKPWPIRVWTKGQI